MHTDRQQSNDRSKLVGFPCDASSFPPFSPLPNQRTAAYDGGRDATSCVLGTRHAAPCRNRAVLIRWRLSRPFSPFLRELVGSSVEYWLLWLARFRITHCACRSSGTRVSILAPHQIGRSDVRWYAHSIKLAVGDWSARPGGYSIVSTDSRFWHRADMTP